jgi:hypothetical protein
MTDSPRRRRIPPSKAGLPALNLSLGNPDLVPVKAIRELRARHWRGLRYELNAYAEDNNLDGFCEGIVKAFTGFDHTQIPTSGRCQSPASKRHRRCCRSPSSRAVRLVNDGAYTTPLATGVHTPLTRVASSVLTPS